MCLYLANMDIFNKLPRRAIGVLNEVYYANIVISVPEGRGINHIFSSAEVEREGGIKVIKKAFNFLKALV